MMRDRDRECRYCYQMANWYARSEQTADIGQFCDGCFAAMAESESYRGLWETFWLIEAVEPD